MAIGVRFTTLRLRFGMVSLSAYRRLGSPRGPVASSEPVLDGELLSSPVDRLAVVTCRLWYASLTCRQFPGLWETVGMSKKRTKGDSFPQAGKLS